MPSISRFLGITLYMYWNDHKPPHFHVKYGEYKALIDIQEISVCKGELPHRTLSHLLEWTEAHKEELLMNWDLLRNNQYPLAIEPLK